MKKKKIIVDERYHTCKRCKWRNLSYDLYPCSQCIRGPYPREDLWEYDEESNIPQPEIREWISIWDKTNSRVIFKCSNCSEISKFRTRYCPNCGKKQIEEEDN